MTDYGGPGASYGYGYSYGATPTLAPAPDRLSPAVQILISSLLVLPTILIQLLNSLLLRADWVNNWPDLLRELWVLGCNTLLWLYFVVVIAVWARPARRGAAVAIAIVTMLFDTAVLGAVVFLDLPTWTGLLSWVYGAAQVLILLGQVTAWGVARRRSGIWAVGLIAAVVCGVVVQWAYRSLPSDVFIDSSGWIVSWALYVGAFVLCCLICSLLDTMGSSSRRATTPLFPGR